MTVMEIAMIHALAAIDEALGLPPDGCNSTARTLAKIKELREQNDRCERLAQSVMSDIIGAA